MKYRIGLDLGTNSLGWCVLELEQKGKRPDGNPRYRPCRILDTGVRILTPNDEAGRDPQSKNSLAAGRRDARSARRRRDRFLRRQQRLMETLIASGLMPTDKIARKALEKLNPYWLRAAALDDRLELHEIGRALFHLNQRRGFRSNRIADAEDSEKSATKDGMRALEAALSEAGVRTLGEFLSRRHRRDRYGNRLKDGDGFTTPEAVRFRPTVQGSKNLYDFYPSRWLIERELDAIWKAQSPHHPELTDSLLTGLKRIIIEQRPLKKPVVGRCTLRPEADWIERFGITIDMGERAPKAHPLFQRFRILQDTAQLRVVRPGRAERPLSVAERSAIAARLMSASGNTVAFDKLRQAAKLPADARFNYELSGRKGLQPDQTAAKLANKNAFGKPWRNLARERQIEVVERLLAEEDEGKLLGWLRSECGLSDDAAETASNMRLPQGHGQFGRATLGDLVSVMEKEGRDFTDPVTGEIYQRPLTYDEAVKAVDPDLHHSDLRAEATVSRLAYYGEVLARHVVSKPDAPEGSQERIGRVPNPTVHIALNQLRKLINALIDEYGPPTEISIELARELKLNRERKDRILRENRENEKKNEARRERLAELKVADTHDARLRLRLFDELPADERVCVYSGEPLSVERVLTGDVDIDHILPHSRTLDDSFMNKVLCTRASNRQKGNRAPAEVWSGTDLADIFERAERIVPKKAWRFQPDAMDRFDAEGGFLARQLTDTQHMARLARSYLEHVCTQVWAPPGRLTAMLRAKWGLNELLPDHNYTNTNHPKNRKDHRHHAIDAFVVGCTDRGLLQRIARASGQAEELDLDRLFAKDSFPEPYDGFREDLRQRLAQTIVSHKPDHGLPPGGRDDPHTTSGQLHEATAYGLVDEVIDGKRFNLVTRKPATQLTEGEIGRIRDARLREDLTALADEAKYNGQKLADVLADYAEEHGIRRVRILKTEQSVRTVWHGSAREFQKAYTPGDNHCIEIFEMPDGRWAGEGITVHDANQKGYQPRWRKEHPSARMVMRLHGGDLIEADFGGGTNIYRVCVLDAANNRVRLAPHNEAGSLGNRHNAPDSEDPFRYEIKAYSKLKAASARRVQIDVLGRISGGLEQKP